MTSLCSCSVPARSPGRASRWSRKMRPSGRNGVTCWPMRRGPLSDEARDPMPPFDTPLELECLTLARRAREASVTLATAPTARKDRWLHRVWDTLLARKADILDANERDLAAARDHGL